MTQSPGDSEYPYRVVDPEWRGWLHVDGGIYESDDPDGLDDLICYEELAAVHGPLRPVLPITDEDEDELTGILQRAGRKAVATLLVGMYLAGQALQEPEEAETPSDKLLAGSRGSWEANSFDTLAGQVGSDLADRPERFDQAGADAISQLLQRWVTDPQRYTEAAETVPSVVSRHAEAAGGWAAIADQWMQPGSASGLSAGTVESLSSYLLSTAGSDRDEDVDALYDA